MTKSTLRVVAHIIAQEKKIEEVRSVLLGLVGPSRDEPDCISYELYQNTERPTEFTFVEEWKSEDALNRHFGTEHIKHAVALFADLLADDLDVRRYKHIA